MTETRYDYHAKLNIEGKRNVWKENHHKIEYIFNRSKKILKLDSSVCEIGIGDGYLLRLLNNLGLNVTGIDISSYLIEKLGEIFANENQKINLLQHDISENIECKTFDTVFCLDILEHIQNTDIAIENIKKLMNDSGILIVTLPWKENLEQGMDKCPCCGYKFHRVGHYHSFQSYDDLVSLLGKNFEILKFGFTPSKYFLREIKCALKRILYRDTSISLNSTCYFIAKFSEA